MGRFAGHNVVCDLLGLPMLPLKIDWYTTILDLRPWGAVCTAGWDRHVATTGLDAKRTKELINRQRIYRPAPATGVRSWTPQRRLFRRLHRSFLEPNPKA